MYTELQAKINQTATVLGIDLDELSEMIYDRGCQFAREYYRNDRVVDKAIADPQYWHWFLIQWHRCDVQMKAQLNTEELSCSSLNEEWYDIFHDLAELSTIKGDQPRQVKPWSEILHRALA